jgi:ribonuclease-3
LSPPRYVITEQGPDHAKQFHAVALIADEACGSGRGSSKKRAEQEAARSALAELDHPGA